MSSITGSFELALSKHYCAAPPAILPKLCPGIHISWLRMAEHASATNCLWPPSLPTPGRSAKVYRIVYRAQQHRAVPPGAPQEEGTHIAGTITGNQAGADAFAQGLTGSLAEYTGLQLASFGGISPGTGNDSHDALSAGVAGALKAWRGLVASDARAIKGTLGALAGADRDLARELMGAGGRP